jgi:uncharacterized Zn finger protein
MSWSYDNDDQDRGAAKARIALEIAKRRKRGEAFEQLAVASPRGNPARTFWGRAWCENLERYSDYESRLPRGRSYLRQGNVYDLLIDPGEIFAYVTGSEIYEVSITIDPLDSGKWRALRTRTTGQIGNLVDLLGGSLGPGVLEAMTDAKGGLFPHPKEIHLSCTCPDWADMCKHVAAVLYGVGVQLDHSPALFFTLRNVDQNELIAAATQSAAKATRLAKSSRAGTGILAPEDLSALFGIEITDPESAFAIAD